MMAAISLTWIVQLLTKVIDHFFADAVEKVLEEKNGRSITVKNFAALAGVSRGTVYTWLRRKCEINRKTLQHKLNDNDPAGELARMVESYYQRQDAMNKYFEAHRFRRIHRQIGVQRGKFSLGRSLEEKNNWIESY